MRSTSPGGNTKGSTYRDRVCHGSWTLRERDKLHFHLQVKNISEANSAKRDIKPLVLPWSKIITDAMPSYADLQEHGYDHDFVLQQIRSFCLVTRTHISCRQCQCLTCITTCWDLMTKITHNCEILIKWKHNGLFWDGFVKHISLLI